MARDSSWMKILLISALLWCGIPLLHARAGGIESLFRGIHLGPGTLDLGGSLRLRYEYFDNYNIKTYGNHKEDTILLSRLRINVGYNLPLQTKFFVQLQDARFFFSDLDSNDFGPSCPYENELDLRQAFWEMRQIGDTPMGFKIGRQVIKYGDYRIFGPGDWGNVGRYTWDAGKILVETPSVRVDLFAANRVLYLKNRFDDEHFPYHVYAAYGHIESIPQNTLDFFYIIKQDSDEISRGKAGVGKLLVNTAGFYGKGFWKRLDYSGTFAYQFGDYSQDSIGAVGFNAEAGYTVCERWKPRLALSLSYASGDKNPGDHTYGTFDGVFGAVDKFYGRMNLFSWMNLVDLQVGVSVKPVQSMKFSLDFHRFQLAQAKDAWYYSTQKKDALGSYGRIGHGPGRRDRSHLEVSCSSTCDPHGRVLRLSPGTFHPGDRASGQRFLGIRASGI